MQQQQSKEIRSKLIKEAKGRNEMIRNDFPALETVTYKWTVQGHYGLGNLRLQKTAVINKRSRNR